MSVADKMPEIREMIFGVIGDRAFIGSEEVKGKFFLRYREIQMPDGSISALDISFDCQVSDIVLALVEDDTITIKSTQYKFRRHIPIGGDESGLCTLELKQ
jgi:hypothetical protein